MAPEDVREVVLEGTPGCGIETDESLDADPYGLRVVWIEWDSPFRGLDLTIGDLVVGVDGIAYTRAERERITATGVGRFLESQRWDEIGATDGGPVTLTVK